MTFVLGLTGGIATGKSTAAQFFRKQKIPVIDADQIAHQAMAIRQPNWWAIRKKFGSAYFKADQTINRQKLASFVFRRPDKLKLLDQITHPFIKSVLFKRLQAFKKEGAGLVIAEIPLLYESDSQNLCNRVLVISLPQRLEIERLMQRNKLSVAEARERVESQMPIKEKEAKADYVIANTGTIRELEEKLAHLLAKIEAEM